MPYRDERASRAELVVWLIGTPVAIYLVLWHPDLLSRRNIWRIPAFLAFMVGIAGIHELAKRLFRVPPHDFSEPDAD